MGSRFFRPDTDTLTLANGDTLTVKRRLNAGENRVKKGMEDLSTLREIALVLAYLIDWSLVGLDGITREPIAGLSRPDLVTKLDALGDDEFDEIYAAIAAHASKMKAERAEEKKRLMPGDAPIFSSPSAAAGASSGSASST